MTNNTAKNSTTLPYQEILPKLLISIKNAYREFYSVDNESAITLDVSHAKINSHFIWLTTEKSVTGSHSARHLFDAVRPLRPLASKSANEDSLDVFRTRISSLIHSKISSKEQRKYSAKEERRPRLPSILNVALDFLTIPHLPASRAYALMTLNYFIFSSTGYYPCNKNSVSKTNKKSFDEKTVRRDILSIETYLRQRFESQGGDFIPQTKDSSIVTKHYLAMLGVLDWKFETSDGLLRYLNSNDILPSGLSQIVENEKILRQFEFARAGGLAKLPDAEEVVNGIIGLPLPIRGADTIFRGGLRFPAEGGLIMAVSGSPGSGKTALSLAIGASLAPFGINTLFLSAEEGAADLASRADSLIADDISRLSFFAPRRANWLKVDEEPRLLPEAQELFDELAKRLRAHQPVSSIVNGMPSACSAVVVLDGLHDRFTKDKEGRSGTRVDELRAFVETCRSMNALVILTTGTHSESRQALDYLVDISVHLRQESSAGSMSRPERYLDLIKARHQLCSIGTHCMQISGSKGFRFTPQANYQIDRQSIHTTVLHTEEKFKLPFANFCKISSAELKSADISNLKIKRKFNSYSGKLSTDEFFVYKDSNIFINGEGSSNKAALALKLAMAPTYDIAGKLDSWDERILVVSFLYPENYYRDKMKDVVRADKIERAATKKMRLPQLSVIQLYPGTIGPDTLFNKIIWEIEAAELMGCPFTSIIIDGIHNVFLQFPRIEAHGLFWPQLYSVLRTRKINIITTHTVLNLGVENERDRFYPVDDHKSDPLRQALVQKTDFRFEIDPVSGDSKRWKFKLDILSAIGQPVPDTGNFYWSREHLVFYREPPVADEEGEKAHDNRSRKLEI